MGLDPLVHSIIVDRKNAPQDVILDMKVECHKYILKTPGARAKLVACYYKPVHDAVNEATDLDDLYDTAITLHSANKIMEAVMHRKDLFRGVEQTDATKKSTLRFLKDTLLNKRACFLPKNDSWTSLSSEQCEYTLKLLEIAGNDAVIVEDLPVVCKIIGGTRPDFDRHEWCRKVLSR